MAAQAGLRWATLPEVIAAARAFLDPILAGELDATWDPASGSWGPRAP